MYRKTKIPDNIIIYWQCEQCLTLHQWPQERAKRYCNKSCQDKAYYARKKAVITMKVVEKHQKAINQLQTMLSYPH